jgi:hypothetical protein
MRKARGLLALIALSPMLSGCLVIGTAAAVTDVAVGTAGMAVGAAGAVGGAAVDAIIPGDGNKDERDL